MRGAASRSHANFLADRAQAFGTLSRRTIRRLAAWSDRVQTLGE